MHICFIILSPFDYDSRARLICRDILAAGYDLSIIATEGGSQVDYQGVTIKRIKQTATPFRQRRFLEFNIEAAALASRLNADIYHAVDLDTLWAAVTAARHKPGKILYEARELYTELLSLNGRPIVKWFWRNLEKRYIHKADAVVTINHSIADELVIRYRIDFPEIAMNVAPAQEIPEPVNLRKKFNLEQERILIYQGILRPGQGLERCLNLMAHLHGTGLIIIGEGPFRGCLEERINKLDIADRVRFSGKVSPDELLTYTAGADAGLLLMESEALNNYLALPQKLFQYITSGTPPIVSDLPELRGVVKGDNLGLVLNGSSVESDAQVIWNFLAGDLPAARENCLRARSKYNWEIEGRKIIEIYRGLA